MSKFVRNILLTYVSIFASSIAWAYPEMIRHGYTHCASCHFNPAGGGVLTSYGKSISSELLSRWNYKGEERILHGALSKNASSYIQGEKDPSLILGGDLRYIQLHQENKAIRKRRWFLMQADVEAGVKWKNLLLVTTFGQETKTDTERWRFRKTFLKAQVTDSVSVKAGRSHPNLGLMISEHFLSSRSDSGLHPLEYKDLVEFQGNFENFGFVVGAEQSPYERNHLASNEKGFYAQGDYIVDNHKLGLHYWNRQAESFKRNRLGAHAILGVSKKFAVLADYQFQQEEMVGQKAQWGFFGSGKLTYEPFKGFWLSLWLDYSQRKFSDNNTVRERVGPGIQFFPRPHFDIQALWLKDHSHKTDEWGDYAMLILHYYL